jgi:hypothetical protein
MASPSEAEVQAQLKAGIDLLDETRKFGNVNGTNWVGQEDVLVQLLESDYQGQISAAVANIRRQLASSVSRSAAVQLIRPLLLSYVKHVVGKSAASDQEMFDILYRWFFDTTVTVKTRAFTFNSPAAGGSNVGDGTVLRVTKDENGFDLEAATAEAKEARCIRDRNTGTGLDQEIFRFRGAPVGLDTLQVSGSGATQDVPVLNWQSSLLQNTSFESFSGTIAAPTDITSWTSNVTVSGTTYSLDETNYYRPQQGITTPRALNIKSTSNIVQKLSTFNRKLDPLRPYFLQIAWNRTVGSGAGTLLIRLGAQSNSVVAAAQAGWQVLRCPTTFGTNNWYKAFDEQDLDISIEWTRTSGDLLIDDVLLVPMTLFDGTWYAITANDATHAPFLKDDIFTWTDTATDSVLQYWFWRAFGRYLPHSGAPSITDP